MWFSWTYFLNILHCSAVYPKTFRLLCFCFYQKKVDTIKSSLNMLHNFIRFFYCCSEDIIRRIDFYFSIENVLYLPFQWGKNEKTNKKFMYNEYIYLFLFCNCCYSKKNFSCVLIIISVERIFIIFVILHVYQHLKASEWT